MANKQIPPGDDRSEVEFLYFKGKLRSADIQALVSGFAGTRSSALPGRQVTKRIANPGTQGEVAEEADEPDLEGIEDAEVEASAAVSAPRTARGTGAKRVYPTPDTLDIDLEAGDKPFRKFAIEKAPASHQDKYLVVAEWLRAFGDIPEVTTGHVRTCYIGAGWDFDLLDPTQPFRKLKKAGLGMIADGKFTIKHLGTSAVNKMTAQP
jgi:hypothetical protein